MDGLGVLLAIFSVVAIIGTVFFAKGILDSNQPELIFGFVLMAIGIVVDIISLFSDRQGSDGL